jgi:hypothetical protein
MADYEPKAAMRGLINLVKKTRTNNQLIDQFKSIVV